MKYCCVLIAQVEESDIKGRNDRSQHLDTSFQQNKCLLLVGYEKYPIFLVTAKNTLKFNIFCI